jgi:S1-C subfamily serine protease
MPPSLVLLAHRFVAAPRNTESIPSSPRLALGQKPGDLRDPDDASVDYSATFLAAVAIVGLGGTCLTVDVAWADARKIVERYRDAVVPIALKTSHDTPESAHCAGFVVPPGESAADERPRRPSRAPQAAPRRLSGTTGDDPPGRVLGVDVRHDLAMLEVDGALDVTNAVDVVAGRDIPHGGKYVTLGFPLDLRLTADEGTANARDGNVLYPELEFSGTANPGASGSPLFDEEGVFEGIFACEGCRRLGPPRGEA